MTNTQTTPTEALFRGVEITSRKNLDFEIEVMRKIVEGLGAFSASIERIWCDSSAGATYTVTVADGMWHDGLPEIIAEAAYATGGYNGVYIEADGGHSCSLEADWPGDRLMVEELVAWEEAEAQQLKDSANMSLPDGFLERLRGAMSLSQVASRWVKWDDRKSNPPHGDYWGSCPFHEETSSSFNVNDRKGYFYCFGCHARGDALTLIMKKENLTLIQAARRLAFITGLDNELVPPHPEPPKILQIKEIIVKNFTKENFLEVGLVTGWAQYIRSHDRLLRSLSWGDPDYAGNVLELLTAMQARDDGSYDKLQAYITTTFSEQSQIMSQTAAFSATKTILGYTYVAPRNDIIGVMMPFQPSFRPVYEAIQRACGQTSMPAKRADEVWNNSTVISDILELINHSAVVICDLTGRNENVFYELGIAHAWGKTVIPITQNAADVPFDLRHHRYLQYLNNGEGLAVMERDLAKRLTGVLGSPF